MCYFKLFKKCTNNPTELFQMLSEDCKQGGTKCALKNVRPRKKSIAVDYLHFKNGIK